MANNDLLLQYICKRMNGEKYGAPEFYWWVSENLPASDAKPILAAIDSGEEQKVQQAIFGYFDKHDLYELALCYVRAVKWLDDDPEDAHRIQADFFAPMFNPATGKNEFTEVFYTYWADTKLTTRRQVQQGYEMALKAGMKPWRICAIEFLDYKNNKANPFGADFIDITPSVNDRGRIQEDYNKWYADNFTKCEEMRKPFEFEADYSVLYCDTESNGTLEYKCRKKNTITQFPIVTKGRKYHGIEGIGDDHDE